MSLLFWCSLASAHQPGLSFAQFGDDTLALTFARPEIVTFAPDLDPETIKAATLGRLRLTVNGADCTLTPGVVMAVESDGLQVTAEVACPPGESRTLTVGYFEALALGHRVFVENAGGPVAVLDRSAPSTEIAASPSTGAVALRFLSLGMEHIVTGYDHLAFLVGLLLVARGLREMLLIVTGFTVAHSITLSLGATGVFTLSPTIVEPAIAASIAFIGIENFWNPSARRRLATTFLLGLIHGFGFAGLLTELGLPRSSLFVALGSFNLGVEVGQAAVVAAVLPLLLLLRRREWWSLRAVPILSVFVALSGVFWLVERLTGG